MSEKSIYAPEFIFLDWYLTGVDGAENLMALRQISKLINSQIIIYSGYIEPKLAEKITSAYNCKYLKKEDSLSVLTESLNLIFAGKELY